MTKLITMDENLNSGNFIFKPRARIIKTIGEELISNDNVAVIELVKNSYDAESQVVDIVFEGKVQEVLEEKKRKRFIECANASITIYDDGNGMSFKTIESAWMEPATNFKKKTENKNRNRKFTGEKGIGRFASAKLASKLELITKEKGSNQEIVVRFDWNDFSDDESYLENIVVQWEKRDAILIKNSGTALRLIGLNSDWEEDKIRDLRVSLSRLLNPLTPDKKEDFLINIELPNSIDEKLKGFVSSPETLNKPDYYIKGLVNTDGEPKDFKIYSKKEGKETTLDIKELRLESPNRDSMVGEFSFEFRVWNRDPDSMEKLAIGLESKKAVIKKDLDELSGISIYRDDIRVLPYGSKGNDWIRLNSRRINNPTLRLSNNQLVGYVSIGLDNNPELKDQSNREGIVDSQAFEDLKEYITIILNEVEKLRYSERDRESDNYKNTLFDYNLSDLIALVDKPDSTKEDIKSLLVKKSNELKIEIKNIQEVVSRYRNLSTLGSLTDTLLHDGNKYLGLISNETFRIERLCTKYEDDINLKKVFEYSNNIESIRESMRDLFKRYEPFGGKKRGRPEKIHLLDFVMDQFALYSTSLESEGINYRVMIDKDEIVEIDRSDLANVFVNLIDNSIYWLGKVEKEKTITVNSKRTEGELIIDFSDSGPGIEESSVNAIFDPYYSEKTNGIGLGLSIIGEIMKEYEGELLLLEEGKLEGANFRLIFRRRI